MVLCDGALRCTVAMAHLVILSVLSIATARASPTAVTHEPADTRAPPSSRCFGAKGGWCGPYYKQPLRRIPPPPVWQKPCPSNCSGLGTCNHVTQQCDCPAGSTGKACDEHLKRPCTNRWGGMRTPEKQPFGHIGADMRDLDINAPGLTASRCAGVCDDTTAACYCDGEKYGRIPPPPGSPPGTPPIREGRQLSESCGGPSTHPDGSPSWGHVPFKEWNDSVYGPQGWCNVDVPEAPLRFCGCVFEGWDGPMCTLPTEHFCPNQCSGHGTCDRGFCHCHAGWWGADCAERVGGVLPTPSIIPQRPWLQLYAVDAWTRQMRLSRASHGADPSGDGAALGRGVGRRLRQQNDVAARMHTAADDGDYDEDEGSDEGQSSQALLALLQGSSRLGAFRQGRQCKHGRLRPYIYVYNLPPLYQSLMLQYRLARSAGTWRVFDVANKTQLTGYTYGMETHLHELLLQSPHRTLDPEEADFFYVPVYATVWQWPVSGWADYPWFSTDTPLRIRGASVMFRDALEHIKTHYPYWNRTPESHIFLFAHDEGACAAPTELYEKSIILAHWGRMDPWPHASGTSYEADNYTFENPTLSEDPTLPQGYQALFAGHPCYNASKDLIIPNWRTPHHYRSSPFMGAKPVERDWLAFHRGRGMGKHAAHPIYSRGVRQKLYKLAKEQDWAGKYSIFFGDNEEVPGDYSDVLARSVFGVVVAGDGWTARYDDAMLHGCIPVIIIDNVHGPFENIMQWDTWSIKVAEAQVANLPEILLAIPKERIEAMQRNIARVWHKFAWLSHQLPRSEARWIRKNNLAGLSPEARKENRPEWLRVLSNEQMDDDALHTLMQWLYYRLQKRRGDAAQRLMTAADRPAAAAASPSPQTAAVTPSPQAAAATPSPSQAAGASQPGRRSRRQRLRTRPQG